MIVEGKDKLGRLKSRIYLDPKNLNVAVIREPWFSKTPDDIAHLLAAAQALSQQLIVQNDFGIRLLMKSLPISQHLVQSMVDSDSL